MPRYDYFCASNGRTLEVRHGAKERLASWGELCASAGLDPLETSLAAAIERVIHAPALSFPRGNAELKSQGFTKLVRRDDGVYENVTAGGDESRVVHRDDPASSAGLGLSEKIGD